MGKKKQTVTSARLPSLSGKYEAIKSVSANSVHNTQAKLSIKSIYHDSEL